MASILASDLAQQYRIVVICARKAGKYDYPVSPDIEIMYIPGLLDSAGRYIRPLEKYMKALKKVQNVHTSISLLYLMNRLNVNSRAEDRVICSERNNPQKGTDLKRFEKIQRIYEKTDHVVFQSETVRGLFNKDVQGHSSILPNCLLQNINAERACKKTYQILSEFLTYGRS